MKNNNSPLRHLPWLVLAIVGACALGVVALRRGEAINALWIVVAAVAIYLVAYRYYSLFIANNVMQLDGNRATPAVLNKVELKTEVGERVAIIGANGVGKTTFMRCLAGDLQPTKGKIAQIACASVP